MRGFFVACHPAASAATLGRQAAVVFLQAGLERHVRRRARTRGLLTQQPMLIMPTMQDKIEAQVRGLGCGYLPLSLAAAHIARGLLMVCPTEESIAIYEDLVYAWQARRPGAGLAWWLERLGSPRLCASLLEPRAAPIGSAS